jgi:addiction module RelE/StbE family toxin
LPNAELGADWAPAAERDVDEIWDYYAETASSETAERLLTTIFAAVARIAAHPFQGRPRTDFRPLDLRSVRAPPYLIFYRVESDRVQIVRVLHERRDLPAALAENGQ